MHGGRRFVVLHERDAEDCGGRVEVAPCRTRPARQGRAHERRDGARVRHGAEKGLDQICSTDVDQDGRPHSPRLACCTVAAWERDLAKRAEPLEARCRDGEEFSAPDAALGTESDAVEREAEGGRRAAELGHDDADVRGMVRNLEKRFPCVACEPFGKPRREEIRMAVGGVRLRFKFENGREMFDRLF